MPNLVYLSFFTGLTLLVSITNYYGESAAKPDFTGGFETADASEWGEFHCRSALFGPPSFRVVTQPVREGRYAGQFVVRSGDRFRQLPGERCDLERPFRFDESEGDEYWYAWSTLFPTGWRRPRDWFVVADWHSRYKDVCQLLQIEVTEENVLLAKVLSGDVSGYRCFEGSGSAFTTEKIIADAIQPGIWNDLIIHVLWTAEPEGFIEIYYKRAGQGKFKKVVNLRNIPTLQHQGDKDTARSPFFKLAHYRSQVNRHTSTLYHDGFRQGRNKQSLASGELYNLD